MYMRSLSESLTYALPCQETYLEPSFQHYRHVPLAYLETWTLAEIVSRVRTANESKIEGQFLISVALTELKLRDLYREESDPRTGEAFKNFTEYVRWAFPSMTEDLKSKDFRKKVHRHVKIGLVFIQNKGLFTEKKFTPAGNTSKLLFWESAVKNHPEMSPPQIFDRMVSMKKRQFEQFSASSSPCPAVSTHVHCAQINPLLRLYTARNSVSKLASSLLTAQRTASPNPASSRSPS